MMSWHASIKLHIGKLTLDVELSGTKRPLAIIGPNGSGKSTLLRAVAGAYTPETGSIGLGDKILFDSQQVIDCPPELREIGYVPQGYGLFPHLKVVDNVAFGLLGQSEKLSREKRREAAMDQLKELGCGGLAQRWPRHLSGGECQRIALARALMTKPRLLLLDEPLAALDVTARRSLRSYLGEHLEQAGIPSMVVTHDLRDVIALNANVVVLESGRIVQQGDLDSLRAKPASDFVAEFCNA